MVKEGDSMLRIGILTGSTRPNRKSADVAQWVLEIPRKRSADEYELVDIKDVELPLLDEPVPPAMGKYQQPHTKRWAAKIVSLDAFVFVTPEYNHGIPAALKNAIDFLFAEWKDKAAGFVSYGAAGGARAVEQLRLVLAEVHVATVRAQVLLSMMTDFENFTTFKPHLHHEKYLGTVLDEARRLAALAKKKGVLAVAGLQARSAPSVAYVRDLIKQGYVGEVLSTTLIGSGMGWGPTVEPYNAYLNDRKDGATMLSIAVGHAADALCHCLGEVRELSATMTVRRKSFKIAGTGESETMTADC